MRVRVAGGSCGWELNEQTIPRRLGAANCLRVLQFFW